ncbi:hypothetical protein T484DRAFT_1986653 [Baffinella frigidus]|nr:hypothetical protein T484DRAFT_1986653 [Cryptophyta sp. CCMP2293]|mmetsp:Transcript_53163/g.125816  ORF Transcript_53163/g.125816 Transcript_53163/m.125816 type:complete len:176 (+) Transcript_53163:1232-1759(+)
MFPSTTPSIRALTYLPIVAILPFAITHVGLGVCVYAWAIILAAIASNLTYLAWTRAFETLVASLSRSGEQRSAEDLLEDIKNELAKGRLQWPRFLVSPLVVVVGQALVSFLFIATCTSIGLWVAWGIYLGFLDGGYTTAIARDYNSRRFLSSFDPAQLFNVKAPNSIVDFVLFLL